MCSTIIPVFIWPPKGTLPDRYEVTHRLEKTSIKYCSDIRFEKKMYIETIWTDNVCEKHRKIPLEGDT